MRASKRARAREEWRSRYDGNGSGGRPARLGWLGFFLFFFGFGSGLEEEDREGERWDEGGLGFLVGFNGFGLTGQGETAPPTGGLVSIGDRQCHGRFGVNRRPPVPRAVWYQKQTAGLWGGLVLFWAARGPGGLVILKKNPN